MQNNKPELPYSRLQIEVELNSLHSSSDTYKIIEQLLKDLDICKRALRYYDCHRWKSLTQEEVRKKAIDTLRKLTK